MFEILFTSPWNTALADAPAVGMYVPPIAFTFNTFAIVINTEALFYAARSNRPR